MTSEHHEAYECIQRVYSAAKMSELKWGAESEKRMELRVMRARGLSIYKYRWAVVTRTEIYRDVDQLYEPYGCCDKMKKIQDYERVPYDISVIHSEVLYDSIISYHESITKCELREYSG